MTDYDAIYELEKWNNSHKAHSVSIDIDNGYGATCWTVTLYKGKRKVVCSETNFIESEGIDPMWQEHEGDLYCVVVDGDEMDDWPGLNATIKRAIECAEKFFAA